MSKAKAKRSRGRQGKQGDDRETLAFKVLSAENTKKLSDIDDVDVLQESLAEILQINDHPTDLKSGAVVDYYVAAVWWGKEQGYSSEQLSAFYTVVHTLLDNIKDKQLSVTENLKVLRGLLAGIGQDREGSTDVKLPSGGLETLFDVNQAKTLTDYVYTSLFQHYRLFEFTLGHTQAEEIIGTDLEVEVPPCASLPWPPPLDEGVTLEIHTQHIATPPPTPVPETTEEAPPAEGPASTNQDAACEETVDGAREAAILAELSPQDVQRIMDEVFEEMLPGVKVEVAAKLREKENGFINRINKVHNVAEK